MPTPAVLSAAGLEFVADRHLATLATLRADSTPHSVPVGFTFDAAHGLVRVITSDGNQKVRNVERGGYAAVTQLDGARWLTLEGPARIARDAADVREAEDRYTQRYRPPRENPRRVVIVISVQRTLGTADFRVGASPRG
jgi:PPOX class probable F420-dependent enzyme